MKSLHVDEVFDVIGHLGHGQLLYLGCFGMMAVFTSFHMLLNIFTGLDPSFTCYSKDSHKTSESLDNECFNNTVSECHLLYHSGFNSFAMEWDLVCDRKPAILLVQSVFMAGVMLGALLLGSSADIFGRLKALFLSLIGTVLFEGFSSYAPTYMMMVTFRFLGGMCCAVVILSSFVLSQELVGASKRTLCGVVSSILFSIGIALLSAVSSVVGNWRTLSFIASILGIIVAAVIFLIPESPRWLISKGMSDEAEEVMRTIAMYNGTTEALAHQWSLSSSSSSASKRHRGSVFDLFKHSYLAMLTLIQVYTWFVNSASYYGLTLAASTLGGNVYISTALNGLVEIPANLALLYVMDSWGRRITVVSSMILSGVMCILIKFVDPTSTELITALALSGKLTISASFSAIYVFSGEIFPTVIRNSAMGVVAVAARFGGIMSPFILMLGDVHPNAHFVIFGLLAILSGFLSMKLPETAGKPLPETMDDMLAYINFGEQSFANEAVELSHETECVKSVKKKLSSDEVPLIHSSHH